MEEKPISRDTGAGRYFFLEIRRVRGITIYGGNGKSEGVGGLQLKFLLWWGSGHFLETLIL